MKRRVLSAIEVSRVSVIFYDALCAGLHVCVCVCVLNGWKCNDSVRPNCCLLLLPQRVGLTKAQPSSITSQADKDRRLQLKAAVGALCRN